MAHTDADLRKLWRDAGGSFYGPHVEHGDMEEAKLLPFLRKLLDAATSRQEGATIPWAPDARWPASEEHVIKMLADGGVKAWHGDGVAMVCQWADARVDAARFGQEGETTSIVLADDEWEKFLHHMQNPSPPTPALIEAKKFYDQWLTAARPSAPSNAQVEILCSLLQRWRDLPPEPHPGEGLVSDAEDIAERDAFVIVCQQLLGDTDGALSAIGQGVDERAAGLEEARQIVIAYMADGTDRHAAPASAHNALDGVLGQINEARARHASRQAGKR